LAVVVSTVYAANIVLSDDVVASYSDAYEKYLVKYNKHYGTKEEHDKHLLAYATSMERVKEFYRNHPDSQIKLGETSRSDLLKEERGLNKVRRSNNAKRSTTNVNTFPQPKLAKDHTADNVPEAFNWLNVSDVKHPAKDQGDCGSCWALSAIGALEMQSVLEGNKYVALSSQQAIDCSGFGIYADGCCGGESNVVYDNITEFVKEVDYPYDVQYWNEATDKCMPYLCEADGKETAVTINGYDLFLNMAADELKKQIWMYGPVTISIECPDELVLDYDGGVFDCTLFTIPPDSGHTIVAVGFGNGFITLRNSWGEDWGLEGDFLLSDKDFESSCHLLSSQDPITRVSAVGVSQPSTSSSSSSTTVSGSSSSSKSASASVSKSSSASKVTSTSAPVSSASVALPSFILLAFLFYLLQF